MANQIPVGGQLAGFQVEILENGEGRLILTDQQGRSDSFRLKPGEIESLALSILSLTLSTEESEGEE